MTKKRIKFVKGVLLPYLQQAYDLPRNVIESQLKDHFQFTSFSELEPEQIDEIIYFCDELLKCRNIDINHSDFQNSESTESQ